MVLSIAGALVVSTALHAAAPALADLDGQGAIKAARPSVILITIGSLRADVLGAYGAKQSPSPALDAFAQKSTVFERVESSIPETLPSHVTIMSGCSPSRHGIYMDGQRLGPEIPMVAKELRASGCATAAFVSSSDMLNRSGIAQGFETYDDSFFTPKPPRVLKRGAKETLSDAGKWVAKAGGKPFFCWVHLADADQAWSAMTGDVVKMERAVYKSTVKDMDAELGAFFSALAESGKMDKLVTVICSDHGAAIDDHGEPNHGIFLYDSTTRVPLMIRSAGQVEGRRIKTTVGLVDVAPTLRDIMGLPAPECDGVSLKRAVLEGAEPAARPLFLESPGPFDRYCWSPLFAVVSGGRKLVVGPREELYNLAADPFENRNIAGDEPAKVKELSAKFKEWIGKMPKARAYSRELLTKEEEDAIRWTGAIPGRVDLKPLPINPKAPFKNPKDTVNLLKLFYAADQVAADGGKDEATAMVEKLVKQDPSNPSFQFTLGLLYSSPKPFAAMKAFRDAIRAMPSFQPAYAKLCEGFFTYELYDKSLAVAEMGLRRTADDSGRLHYLRAENLAMLKRPPEEVLKDLFVAIVRDPELPGAYTLKAAMFLKMDDKEAALEALTCAKDISTPAMMKDLAKDTLLQPLWADERFKQLVNPSP